MEEDIIQISRYWRIRFSTVRGSEDKYWLIEYRLVGGDWNYQTLPIGPRGTDGHRYGWLDALDAMLAIPSVAKANNLKGAYN